MINESGLTPLEYKVLFRMDTIDEMTEGGIVIPEEALGKEQAGQIEGTFIAAGGLAFDIGKEDEWPVIPRCGDRIVLVARYAGKEVEGVDGETYYIAEDKDIAAVKKNFKGGEDA